MILITQRLARRLKTVLRQALDMSTRSAGPTIQLSGGSHGLRIRCGNGQSAVEFLLDGEQPDETVYIPFELLAGVEGGREVPVEICSHEQNVTASWQDGSVPQLVQHACPRVLSQDWPPSPKQLAENPPQLLTALADARATTDSESTRYALGCIQLRGDVGKVVATDGRQLLLQAGFTFPWNGDVLLPASKVLGSKQLPADEPVLIGKAEDWLVLRVGPWTFWWQCNNDGRFPDVESHIGRPESAMASMQIPAEDRQFLAANLPRLPSSDAWNEPLTVDLNGTVALRAKGQEPPSITELILSGATRQGKPVRINMNRRFLQRAAALGFSHVHIFNPKSPVLACDENRSYAWALLDPESAIGPEENAVRIESPVAASPTNRPEQAKRSITSPMPTQKSNKTTKPSSNGHTTAPRHEPASNTADSIQQATALRTTLREAVNQMSELIRQLKEDQRRSKAVRSTLASLRQLEHVAR